MSFLTWFQDSEMAMHDLTLMFMAAHGTAAICCTLQEREPMGI